MIILLMLIPLSLMLLALAIGAFVWAVRKGQFDDMDTPALDILTDDERGTAPIAAQTRGAINDIGDHGD
ncbi:MULTISPECIES: cbb3-type cytochrome oxidase assembly protein CcoS [unclassified Dyella]|uniref:cbb3-type cytochrome oxidase assembly protein CcoS n=1 Tax=unclassified Dyella TaxID=2634549 RepID=UPI000C856D27|nr:MULTISPECIES: cbb3-type cytochrome oxidase assembly protein CcoS [unclassified Dyella]MDR3444961.1 cbb3-type cytochrome oxidase assembly protein CcoS [Dyella sp.]PMQ05083.1 hypothetical protein DyAD56_12050 [Dyella sp. AD56]